MTQEKKTSHRDEAVLLLNKGKRGLLRVVFGRTAMVILLLAAQVFLLFTAFFRILGDFLIPYVAATSLIGTIMAAVIINDWRKSSSAKLTWIFLIFLIPVLAAPLYFFINMDLGHRLVHHQLQTIYQQTRPLLQQDLEDLAALPAESQGLARYAYGAGGFPLCRGSDARYYPLGEDAFAAMLERLEAAEHFIFLEYFIIEEGYMWGRILSILERKAREGVEVRVLYDGTCSLMLLPYSYPRKLEALGIQCKVFAPLRVLVSTHYNNRDHRKILVIDGKTAFTGGINLADEYINRKTVYGHWKDNAIEITGRAVDSLTLMFLQMWSVEGSSGEDYRRYLTALPVEAPGFLMPFGSCPFGDERVGEMVYLDIINRAKRYVHVFTPYLILDNQMATALTFAARRGVEVLLILPHIPDKKTIFALAKTYYPQLLEGGVQIYEYTPGFVHAKVLVSDDERAVVGTINFDYRSLYLHFECGVYMEGTKAVGEVEADIQNTLQSCEMVTLTQCRSRHLINTLIGAVLRLFAPLL